MAITISPRTKVKLQAVVTLIIEIVKYLVTKLLPAMIGVFLSFLAGFFLFFMSGKATETEETEDEFDKVMKRNCSCDPAEAETNPNNIFYDEYHSNIHNDD